MAVVRSPGVGDAAEPVDRQHRGAVGQPAPVDDHAVAYFVTDLAAVLQKLVVEDDEVGGRRTVRAQVGVAERAEPDVEPQRDPVLAALAGIAARPCGGGGPGDSSEAPVRSVAAVTTGSTRPWFRALSAGRGVA